jgi:hypothetical protein
MGRLRFSAWCVAAIVTLGLSAASLGLAAADPEEASRLRASMHEVYEAIAGLLPVSLDERRFQSAAEKPKIEAWLTQLAAAAGDVERHTGARDPGFGQISRSLARDVAEIRQRYALGRYSEAQFYVAQLTENCVACHSRLPKARDFPIAAKLTGDPAVKELEPRSRARLFVATRQFDQALALWEARFADRSIAPSELDLDGELTSYLVVCVRVQRDYARPRAALEKFAKRPDMPRYLAMDLAAWIAQLQELAGSSKAEPKIAVARAQLERGRALSEFPADRVALIYDLSASSELHRLIARHESGKGEQAEAYYLLGAIDARLDQGSWVSETEQHLESSIRIDPGGPFAEKAYAVLEEYTVLAYGGASGETVPPDVEARLNELRKLVDASKPGRAKP